MPDVRSISDVPHQAHADPARRRWSERLTSGTTVAVLLALFYVLLLASVYDKSATFDEPGHAAAGYSYWKLHDYRLDPENGNLPQRWFGLALLSIAQTFPSEDAPEWRNADTWKVADTWLNRSGNDVSEILRRGRAAAGLLAVALGAVTWWWSRRLFGRVGGMISLLLYILSPTVLAHGALMTSDMAAALFFTVSLGSFVLMLERLTGLRVAFSGLAMGALFLTKMSAPLIVPVVAVVALNRILRTDPISLGGARVLRTRNEKSIGLSLAACAHIGLVGFVIWAAFGFRFIARPHEASSLSRFNVPWEAVLEFESPAMLLEKMGLDSRQDAQAKEILRAHDATGMEWTHAMLGAMEDISSRVLDVGQARALTAGMLQPRLAPVPSILQFARRHQLLPEAYIYGCAHVWKFSRGRSSFLNGRISDTGWRAFFPYAFAIKTPLGSFAVIALALGAFFSRAGLRPPLFAVLPWITLMVVYGAAAIMSQVNLGLRHLLPIFPAMFILAGAAGRWFHGAKPGVTVKWMRWGVIASSAVLATEVLGRHPNYLAYFNRVVRPGEAHRHLIDSSLDWGQELPALKRAMELDSDGTTPLLAYFGTASPLSYGVSARQIYSYLEGDRASAPALKFLFGPQDSASLVAALQRLPDYDSSLAYLGKLDGQPATLVVKRASALQLVAGTYYISASLLQPLHYSRAYGWWTEEHEAVYQQLRDVTQPLLSEHRSERAAAINRFSPDRWNRIMRDFEEYRFARLTASLRERRPDGHINFAILVFRLSETDLDAALNGPPPLGK